MLNYLEFKNAECKDCYKCLRECPVKAIEVINHQAQIIAGRCILCGKCTEVCPQNASAYITELDEVKALLSSGAEVVASVAPSFVSSFEIDDFLLMKIALGKLGFADAGGNGGRRERRYAGIRKTFEVGKIRQLHHFRVPCGQPHDPALLPRSAAVPRARGQSHAGARQNAESRAPAG